MMRSINLHSRYLNVHAHAAPRYAITVALCLIAQWTNVAAHAATFDGHSGLNRNWSTPTNWVENVTPTSGSANLGVIVRSSGTNLSTSNQDLASPFVLQSLSIDRFFPPHVVNGAPLAFTNLGGDPSITSLDFLAPPLTINNDIILNADLTASPPGSIPTIAQYSLNDAISGVGGLRLTNGGRLFLGGTNANTYAGLTTLADGEILLNKPASVIAIAGDLVINTGGSTRSLRGRVVVGNDNQIATGATVTLNSGRLSIEGGNQTLANVKFTGVNIPVPDWDGGNIVISPSRTLTITGGITRTSIAIPPVFPRISSLISGGTLDLDGGPRPFHVDDVNPIGLPTTLTVSSVIANGGIEKTGTGILHLSEAQNTFTGNVLVSGGLFSIGQNGGLMFDLENGGASNRILGTASAFLNGIFTIDAASVTDISGNWNLVDVASLNETFGPEFKLQFMGGPAFANLGGGLYKNGRWTFSTADGNLTLSPVPEPTSALLALAVLSLFVAYRRMPRAA